MYSNVGVCGWREDFQGVYVGCVLGEGGKMEQMNKVQLCGVPVD